MSAKPSAHLLEPRRIAAACGIAVALLGAVVLVAWALGLEALQHLRPGWPAMKANTALGFLALGLALALAAVGKGPVAAGGSRVLATASLAIGALTLVEYLAHADLGIDELLVRDHRATSSFPGRPALPTALDFVLLGWAVAQWHRPRPVSIGLALGAGMVAMANLTFSALGTAPPIPGSAVAVHTTAGFVVAAAGVLLGQPGPVSALLLGLGRAPTLGRWLVTVVLFLPVLLVLGIRWATDKGALDLPQAIGVAAFLDLAALVLLVLGLSLRLHRDEVALATAREQEKAAAETAQDQARRTDLAEEATGRGSWEWDTSADRAVWSKGMYRLFGLDPATFVNSNDNFLAMVHPEDQGRMGQAIADALAKPGRFYQEYRLRRPDGNEVHVRGEGNVRTAVAGKATVVFGFVQDVTAIRAAEAAASRARERFHRIFEASPVPTVLSKEDGRIEDANQALIRMLGYSKDELVAPGFSARRLYKDPQERDRIILALRRSGAVHDRELGLRRKDGRIVQVLIALEFIDIGGNTTILSLFQDITDLKQAQQEREARISSEAELERLRRTDEFRSQFINSTSHELSTPMTPLVLGLSLLRRYLQGNPDALRQLATLERSTERLRRVVADMVSAADLQARAITLDRQRLNVGRQLAAAVDGHQEAAHRGSLTLEAGPDRGLTVLADEQRLQLALGHLIGNALKFTPAGGRVTVSAEPAGDHARLLVTDTGPGLTVAQAGALWKPYRQLHDKAQRTDSGVGLGLYVTKGIVELHGGEVGVSSPGPGKGSTFWFTLPLAPLTASLPPA